MSPESLLAPRRRPRAAVAAALLGLVTTTLTVGLGLVATAPAQAVPSTGLMIAEVYPGGGNASATYNADFVKLYNASSGPISLAGKSLQYRASANTGIPSGTNLFALPEVLVPSHAYFLVKGAGGATGAEIPKTPDAFSSLAMSASAGQIYLADSATGIQPGTGAAIDYGTGKVIDFLGYGSGTTSYETALKSGTIATTSSLKRLTLSDTDNNNTDFTISAVTPGPDNCDCAAPVLKITEVYTEGGTAGATYARDYVEIHNPGTSAVALTGLSLRYRPAGATGVAGVLVPLSGSLGSGSYDIVELGQGTAGNGASVPGVDYTNYAVNLDTAGGTLLIVKDSASGSGSDPGTGAFTKNQYVADLVGWGSSNVYESAPAGVSELTATSSLSRAPGAVDTDMNTDDFSAGTPNPNTAPTLPTRTIAEIQGTGPTTPMPNALVTTTGVVTAVYANSANSFAGLYLQTGGPDLTPGASDGLFVYTGSQTVSPVIGNRITVSGKISEFSGMTEMTLGYGAGTYTDNGVATSPVVVQTELPGVNCALPGTGCLTGAALEAAREEHEGELFKPTAPYTVSDSYDGTPWAQSSSRGFQMAGEIGLAANDTQPLISPTEVASPSTNPAGIAARIAYNNAHMITLDDGANVDYTSTTGTAFPWITPTHYVRVGAAVTFPTPVVLDYRNSLWKLQPQGKVTDDGESFVHIAQDRPATPDDVLGDTGDLKIATFNMLNYFNTFGEDWAATDGAGGARTCTFYSDRASTKLTDNDCHQNAIDSVTGLPIVLPGPRGAANQASFTRQEDKELAAINTMDADVVSLEEVENSLKLYDPEIDGPSGVDKNRDDALSHLVTQLNAHWLLSHPGEQQRWAFVPSPRFEAQPTVLEQDAIRSAFIYDPSAVELVGRSRILVNSAPFRNAREPLAQAFKPFGSGRAKAFAVIVNHLKSKGGPTAPSTVNGDNVDLGDGAGFYNGDRKRQAAALLSFADQFMSDKNISAMFMTGDYNAYSQEDPIKVITAAGYTDLHPANDEKTYSFAGLAGSLDHVFANPEALAMVTGKDVWSINANESVYYEYSRFNANIANLYAPNQFRASDHNPEIIGIDTGADVPDPVLDTVQILATNDFHGRILDNPGDASAGAAALAGAVKGLRAANPNTIFSAAGDMVGASTFESFIANDKPTIDALNEAGLEVSAAGNHEFDKGYHDLVDRIMAAESTTNPDGGARWQYIAANVRFKATELGHTAGDAALPETWCRTLGAGLADPVTVGFVGAVTEDLPALVAAGGIAELEITDIVDSVNTAADRLKTPLGCGSAGPADLVIELVHEGAATTAYSSVTDDSTFGRIVSGADANIDAIVSGHTHLAYNHKVPVPAWSGRTVTRRPVVSAGQYGANLNRLEFEFTPGTHDLVNIRQTILALKDYDADPATQAIVDAAVSYANGAGNVTLGDLAGAFQRARRTDPVAHLPGENRGGESTLGNLIAEVQRWKTDADIGFMNPGGLRADLNGTGTGTPRPLTYRDAANAQPFANTLETMELTGAQIKVILEQQWQRDAENNIPSRPFLRLGTSAGFTSTFDPTLAEGSRITGMFLNGTPLAMGTTYRVSATSFLASGTGDNFWGFAAARNVQDTGKTDLQAVVDYLGAFAKHGVNVLPVDYRQHQVGVRVTGTGTAPYVAGNTLTFTLSSLAMTGADDIKDSQVEVLLDGVRLGIGSVSNTLIEDPPDDRAGSATVTFTVPSNVPDNAVFVVHGLTTNTSIMVPVSTEDGLVNTTVTGQADPIQYGQAGAVVVSVLPSTATGTVTLKNGGTVVGSATLAEGGATINIPALSLAVGAHQLTLAYSGDDTNNAAQGAVSVSVVKATPVITATPTPASVEVGTGTSSIAVSVSATGFSPGGTVTASVGGSVVDTAVLAEGAATLVVGPFTTTGDKSVTVAYLGDATTSTGSTGTTVSASSAASLDTTVSGTDRTMVFGQPTTVAVTVDPSAATGTVTLREDDSPLGTVQLEDGAASVTLAAGSLSVGEHTLTLAYSGDGGYSSSESTVHVNVVRATPVITATPTPASVVVGTGTSSVAVSVSGTGVSPGGTVTASVGGSVVATASLVSGAATLVVGPFTTTGDKSVTIAYLGDATTATGSTGTLVTVRSAPAPGPTDPEPVKTTTSGSSAGMVYGTAGSVDVSVASTKVTSGSVQLLEGTTVLGSGTVNGAGRERIALLGTALETGRHTLTVKYLGDALNLPSQGTVELVVTKAGSATQVAISPSQVVVGLGLTTVQVSVTAAGFTPAGVVEVRVGGALVATRTLASGRTFVELPAFPTTGARTVDVTYVGDGNSGPSSASGSVLVIRATPGMSVTTTPTKVVVGRTRATLVAALSAVGQTVTGQVTIAWDGNTRTRTLSAQQALFELPVFTRAGTHTVRVTYLGSDATAPITKRVTIKVVKAKKKHRLH